MPSKERIDLDRGGHHKGNRRTGSKSGGLFGTGVSDWRHAITVRITAVCIIAVLFTATLTGVFGDLLKRDAQDLSQHVTLNLAVETPSWDGKWHTEDWDPRPARIGTGKHDAGFVRVGTPGNTVMFRVDGAGLQVRIRGIAVPDCMAELSTKWTTARLQHTSSVELDVTGPNPYAADGALISSVIADGHDLAEDLLTAGMADVTDTATNSQRTLANSAKTALVGGWNACR